MARSVSARNWTARSSICWSLARTVLPILRSTRTSNGAVPSRSKPPAMRCGRSCGRDVSKQVSYVSASRFDTMSGNAASSKSESPMHVEPCLFGLDGMLRVFQFRFGTVPGLALVVLLP